MKKIYNYLFPVFFSVFAFAACDEENDEIVSMSYTDPVATVTSINPVEGYVGTQFTVSGDDFGVRTEDIKVYIGSQEAEVVSCEDKAIVAEVPQSATSGKISVVVYGQRINTELAYKVLGKPGVTSVKPPYGFAYDEIVFEGHEFISSASSYVLTFGSSTDKAEIVGTPTEKSFVVKVPGTAASGVMSLAIAGQNIDLASYPFTVLKHATVKEPEAPLSGFAGSRLTIEGTDLVQKLLDEAANEELESLKVTFAKAEGEPVEAIIDQEKLTEKNISLTVPSTLEAGEYSITITTPFETIGKKLTYTVLPMPEVESVAPARGYVGSKITISGKNFVSSAKDIEVKFGDTPAEEISVEGENNNIVVTVPAMMDFGEKTLSLIVQGINIPMGTHTTFELLASPVITSVITDNGFGNKVVQVGNTITITGTGFENSNITEATFKGEPLSNLTVVNNTTITANVSPDCEVGEDVITLHFEGVDADVKSTDKLNMLKAGSDITMYILKNYSSPFTASARQDNDWSEPADWIVNAAAKCNLPYGGLQKGSSLAMQMGWGSHDKREVVDGHIYQSSSSSLPVGKYKLVVSFNEVNLAGSCKAYLAVCKGSSFVSINDVQTSSVVIKSEKIESAGDKELPFEISESGDVSIGVVASIQTNQRFVKFNNVKLLITE